MDGGGNLMATYPVNVRNVADGDPVAAAYTNPGVDDLTQRTDWLKQELDALTVGSVIILKNKGSDGTVIVGNPVYLDTITGLYKPAAAAVDSTALVSAGPSALWEGVAIAASGSSIDVAITGLTALTMAEWNVVTDTGTAVAGPIYLSATAGKVSASPGALGIYIGTLRSDGSIVLRNPTAGPFLNHVHLERTVLGKPAGTVVDPVFGANQVVTTPNPAVQGWLPASATYFPGFVVGVQIPTNAKFGYNIQQSSETLLREVFPFLPETNAQFAQGGLVLDDSKIVVNNYGIWWMDNTYGNAPWPVDYNASPVALDITAWTSRLVAEVSLVESITNSVYQTLADGGIEAISVGRILTADQDSLGVTATSGDNTDGFYGKVTLSNTGVTSIKSLRGVAATGTTTDLAGNAHGLVEVGSNIELPAAFMYNGFSAPQTTDMQPISTNGSGSGTLLSLYAHGLGAGVNDYIDYIVVAGNDLETGVNYQPTVKLSFAVDLPAGVQTAKQVNVSFYSVPVSGYVSSTNFKLTTPATAYTGSPAMYQSAVVGPFANVTVQKSTLLVIRVTNGTGGAALTAGKLRVLDVTYQLTKV
jgi:hypothetical protein